MGGARHELIASVFAGAERSLWIGDKKLAPPGARVVREAMEVVGDSASYRAIGWLVRGPLRESLGGLSRLLAPGATIVLVRDEPPLGALARALRLAPKDDELWLTEASEALLATGLERPRVLCAQRPHVALAGNRPARLFALDDLFTQPRG